MRSQSTHVYNYPPDDLHDWDELNLQNYSHTSAHYAPYPKLVQLSDFNAIFSDDEDDSPGLPPHQGKRTDSGNSLPYPHPALSSGYSDTPLSSSSYYIHQADTALATLKQVVREDGWKKALKHKSGVVVHMKSGVFKGDKAPIFKGESIIQGFSPQSVFYVIGLRRLWDEQYEDGNLVDNLNDTTSLTYEVNKPTSSSKARDLSLVERIECTSTGAIIFACTSVETPRIPRIQGRTRTQIKLQGWILEPVHFSSQPATKVTYIIQESMKGWVPGFAKKSLARRPLVIALVNDYLQKKAERARAQKRSSSSFLGNISQYNQRPSVMNPTLDPMSIDQNKNGIRRPSGQSSGSRNGSRQAPSPTPSQKPILVGSGNTLDQSVVKRHIKFADNDLTYSSDSPSATSLDSERPSVDSVPRRPLPDPPKPMGLRPMPSRHLYPSHRHVSKRSDSVALLKRLSSHSLDEWTLKDNTDGVSTYQLTRNVDEISFIRADYTIQGKWTAEQLCSVIHCYGARHVWDEFFGNGHIVERFSQKEYLVHWFLKNKEIAEDISAITSIDTDVTSGAVYTATTSVLDTQVPEDGSGKYKRVHMHLYGWKFLPHVNERGRTQSVTVTLVYSTNAAALLNSPIDTYPRTCVRNACNYIEQKGFPPYIRRVAGKVIEEVFVSDTKVYKICYIAKHEPSSSYRARKGNTPGTWCTEIRFHNSMYPDGVQIQAEPANETRVELVKETSVVKIYTTQPTIEGKNVTITIRPTAPVITYAASIDEYDMAKEVQETEVASTEKIPERPALLDSFNNEKCTIKSNDDQQKDMSSPAPLTHPLHPLQIAEQSPNPPGAYIEPKSTSYFTSLNTDITSASLRVPKGYMLVPEHQNNNIIIITDELSFNGQQLAVVFIAMVLCYYIGKFASVC
ncbi:hypothetical protein J3Q64DRAFT_1699516 [Phycomyces blakesleeanus]